VCVCVCKTSQLAPSPELTASSWWYNRAVVNLLSVAVPIHVKTSLLASLVLSGERAYRTARSPELLATLLTIPYNINLLTACLLSAPHESQQRPDTGSLTICSLLTTVRAETTSDETIAKQRQQEAECYSAYYI